MLTKKVKFNDLIYLPSHEKNKKEGINAPETHLQNSSIYTNQFSPTFHTKQQNWISFITNTYFKMECKVLDITINSAKDLQDVNLFFEMEVYAVVSIQDFNIIKDDTCMKITHIDKDCGRNPEWNSPMKFYVNTFASQQNRLNLVVELKADKKLGNKDIGEVQVPMKELLERFGESNNEKSVSYSVITPSEEAKGVLYFTYKFS